MSEPAAHPHAIALTEKERERRWPNVRPRPAATQIILDRSGRHPRVLMGKRHRAHTFMPGKFVFPGGGIEVGDREMNVAGTLPAVVEDRLAVRVSRGAAHLARSLALAAIRETFEETGLLIGEDGHGNPPDAPAGAWSDFAAHGIFPSLEGLHFIARAITPPRRPKRFDARFFAIDARAIARRLDNVVGPDTELTELVWQRLDTAATLDLPAITAVVLRELADRIEAGFGHHLPVPFFFEKRRTWLRELL